MLHRRFWTAFVNSLFSGSTVEGNYSRRRVHKNGNVLRRNAGWKSRTRGTEALEDRTVLTPLTGIDFGGGAVPTNWASYSGSSNSTLTTLINEDGVASGFSAVITRDSIPGGASNFTPQASTLPQHTQSLAGIDRIYQDQFGNIQLNWGGLTPGASYEVYVFGGNEGIGNPRVTITGATEIQFGQSHQANQLMVNDQVGDSSRTLSSYAKIMNANASGHVLVRVDRVFQSFFGTAGMAIRPAAASPGFTVTPISGNTNEAGSSATFSVKLNTQPAADVTISLSSDDTTEGTVTQSSLTFTSANWNTPQVVTVTGVDDTVDDDDVVYQIITSAASSTDLDYNGLNPVDVTLTNVDDEIQFIRTSTLGLTVAEGSTNTFTMKLAAQPVADVTVNVSRSSGDTSLSVSAGATLVFTSINWNTPQTITLAAAEDVDPDNGSAVISLTSAGVPTATVTATEADNDPRILTVTIFPNSFSENGGTAVGTVTRNTTDNTLPLLVSLSSSDPGELSVPSSVVIPAGAASVTFDVTGVDDSLLDGTQNVTVTATAVSPSGGLDPTFGTTGIAALSNFRHDINPGRARLIVQPDGKMLVAGSHLTQSDAWNVIRLNPGGGLDTTFGTGGIATTTFTGQTTGVIPEGIALSPTGEILVVGGAAGSGSRLLARYTSSGGLTLQMDLPTDFRATDVVFDSSGGGTFLLAGTNTTSNQMAVRRFLSSGLLDASFGSAGTATIPIPGQTAAAVRMLLQPDGKIVMAGNASGGDIAVARLNSNGTLDTSFNSTAVQLVDFSGVDTVEGLALTPDNKIVIAGGSESQTRWAIARLQSNGSLDTSFSDDGRDMPGDELTFQARSVVVQGDGKIVVGGKAFIAGSGGRMPVVRYNPNGTLDTSFDGDGKAFVPLAGTSSEETRDVAIQPDGKIVALGGFNTTFAVFRLHSAQSPDSTFLPGSFAVQVTDDDVQSLVVSATNVSVNEGSTNTFTVRLAVQPAADVTVNVARISGDSDLTVNSGSTLTFTSANWNTPQTVTVAAAEDADFANGSAVMNVTSSGLTTVAVTVNEVDNDVQSLIVSSASVTVNEGATNTFTVRLAAQPATNVTVSVARTSGDTDLSVSSGSTLTFTSANWNTPQTVTLAAAEDVDIANGSAVMNVTSSGLTTVGVTANEIDNDVQSLVVSTTSVSVNEGSTNTFTVRLAFQPAADVTVSITRVSGDTDLSVTGGGTLTFTSANWNTPQTVTLSAAEDADFASGSAVVNVTSTGLATAGVTANEVDNDAQAIVVSSTSVAVNEGATNTFTVRLAAQPAGNVTVNVARASGDTDLSVSGGSTLTFTSANWNTPQTVTLAAAEDLDLANGSAVVNVTSSGLTTVGVTASEVDNDVQSLIVSSASVSVNEGATNTFTVRLAFPPADNVTVNVAKVSGDTDLTVIGGSTLTFTPANWNTPQTVTLTAAEDADAAQGAATFSVSAAGLTPITVTASETDNDTAALFLEISRASFSENGGSALVAVTRNSDTTVCKRRRETVALGGWWRAVESCSAQMFSC